MGFLIFEYAKKMPEIAILVRHRAKYVYRGDAEEFRVFDWLRNSLEEVKKKFNFFSSICQFPKRWPTLI